MNAVRAAAHAKINLFLRVLSRETSGFHTIETLFLLIDLADTLTLRVGPAVSGRHLDCRGADVGSSEQNLAFRAAAAYADMAGWPRDFEIGLDKRIPVAAGLGGGSSDAGAVLRMLEALSPHPMGDRLLDVAAELGSDVPFFTTGAAAALGWGRGERLLEVAAPPVRPVVLLTPSFGVSSGEAYGWFAATQRAVVLRGAAAYRPEVLGSWEQLARLTGNDLQPAVFARHPELREYLRSLEEDGAIVASMSGSGSTVFGVYEHLPAGASDPPSGIRRTVTRTVRHVVGVQRVE